MAQVALPAASALQQLAPMALHLSPQQAKLAGLVVGCVAGCESAAYAAPNRPMTIIAAPRYRFIFCSCEERTFVDHAINALALS